jgi:hypothetical protein
MLCEINNQFRERGARVTTIFGAFVIVMGLIAWIGQSLSVFALPTAIRFGLFEPEEEVDKSMFLFERFSMGIMDMLLLWILPLSAFLMILGNTYWPLFALVGGGVYLYFPGVFIITRIVLKMHDKKVGRPSSVRAAYLFGSIWTFASVTMIVLAIRELGF